MPDGKRADLSQLEPEFYGGEADHPVLPFEILEIIILMCLEQDPSSRFILARVSSHFRGVIGRQQELELYIQPSVFVPTVDYVSVRRLVRVMGRHLPKSSVRYDRIGSLARRCGKEKWPVSGNNTNHK